MNIKRVFEKQWVVVFGGLYVINQLLLARIFSMLPDNEGIKIQLTFSAEQFISFLENWGQEGINTYLSHYWLDFPHPFIYAIFLAGLVQVFASSVFSKNTVFLFTALPLGAGLLDICENLCHIAMILHKEAIAQPMVFASALFAWTKWILAFVTIGFVLLSMIRRFSGKKQMLIFHSHVVYLDHVCGTGF